MEATLQANNIIPINGKGLLTMGTYVCVWLSNETRHLSLRLTWCSLAGLNHFLKLTE